MGQGGRYLTQPGGTLMINRHGFGKPRRRARLSSVEREIQGHTYN